MLEERERAFPRRPSGARAEPLRPRSPGETPSGAGAGLSPGAELAEAAERRRRGRSREPGLAGGSEARAAERRDAAVPGRGAGGAGRGAPGCAGLAGLDGGGEPSAKPSLSFFSVSFPLPASLPSLVPLPNPPSPRCLFSLVCHHLCSHVRLPLQAPALCPVHLAALTVALTVALCPSL